MARERRALTQRALDRVEKHLLERIDDKEKLHRTQRAGDQRALRLQAREYERRLEALNNENTRLQRILDHSVPRETFDTYKEGEQRAKELARREQRASLFIVASLLLTVVGLVIAYIGLRGKI